MLFELICIKFIYPQNNQVIIICDNIWRWLALLVTRYKFSFRFYLNHIKYIIRSIERTRRAKAAISENSVALERLPFPRSFRWLAKAYTWHSMRDVTNCNKHDNQIRCVYILSIHISNIYNIYIIEDDELTYKNWIFANKIASVPKINQSR